MKIRLYPVDYFDSAYSINFKRYKDMGYKGVIFDLDNTLVEHGAPADERALGLMDELKQHGFQICFLSNNGE